MGDVRAMQSLQTYQTAEHLLGRYPRGCDRPTLYQILTLPVSAWEACDTTVSLARKSSEPGMA